MLKRCLDVCLSLSGLVLAAPVLALAALAIRVSSPGPILYPARRVGKDGKPFVMYKLRTMHHAPEGTGSPITGVDDPRVFRVGALLRKTKVDELPQLLNVLRGEMSIVGPRPEDPEMVAQHYGPEGWETLRVLPGLSSPGTLFHYLYAEDYLSQGALHEAYVQEMLPRKLALDVEYVRRSSVRADLGIIFRTLAIIGLISLGRRQLALDLLSPQSPARVRTTQPG